MSKPSTHPGPIFRTVRVRADQIPRRWGAYQRSVLDEGHLPGVLSGAALKGAAARYAGRYARSRVAVETWAQNLGIRPDYLLRGSPARRCLVWVDTAGQPVRVKIISARYTSQ